MTRPLIFKTHRETAEEKAVRARIEGARSRRNGEGFSFFTCDPLSDENARKLEVYLRDNVESEFKELAFAADVDRQEFRYVIGLGDKSQQNPINKLGGMNCGDQSMKAYWDAAAKATWNVAAINGSEDLKLYLARVAPRSDEGIIVIGGIGRSENPSLQFRISWEIEKAAVDRREYQYVVEVQNGSGKAQYRLDLEGFSRVLKYEDMVVAGDFKLAEPVRVPARAGAGFILEEIRKLENSEVEFYDRIPPLYEGNGGLAEVRTPFIESLASKGQETTQSGSFIEIKFRIPDGHREAYRQRIPDRRGENNELIERGTRKGLAEINSGIGGMRFLNTFGGKSRANRVLTPVTHAMRDLIDSGLKPVPVSGGYLQYWIDAKPSPQLAQTITEALSRRLNSARGDEEGFLQLYLKPTVTLIDAADMRISDVRAAFILKSLGRGNSPVELLEWTDFIVNFNEHISESVKRHIYSELAQRQNGGRRVRIYDLEMLENIGKVCELKKRAVRDTEDLVWALRNDPDLPPEVSKRRGEIETWFFEFAWERGQKIFRLLTESIDRIIKGGYQPPRSG